MTRRLVVVQYAGDFAEAAVRLRSGGPETYRGQRYTVEFVESLMSDFDEVTTVACLTSERYDVTLPSGARAIGLGYSKDFSDFDLCRTVARLRPTHLIIRAPIRSIIYFSAVLRCRVLLTLANSYNLRSLRSRLGLGLLVAGTRLPNVEIVANHGVPSTRQLAEAGAPRAKLVAWDYPAFSTPDDWPEKVAARARPEVAFVGTLVPEKGVGDLIDAVRIVREQGINLRAKIYGSASTAWLDDKVREADLMDIIDLVGPVANDQVIPSLAAADIAVVPSRRTYPEGMPLTVYESLCSRSPVVVSDHPVFADFVRDGVNALVFKSGDVGGLATQIVRLLEDHDLYRRLSAESAAAWNVLQVETKWDQLITAWARSTTRSKDLSRTISLAAQ